MKLLENKKLVLVLGAGASVDYGYPTGDELSRRIKVENIPLLEKYLAYHLISPFKSNFINSHIDSIDDYLERTLEHNPGNNDYYNLGKNFISHIMLGSEDYSALNRHDKSWYKVLFNLVSDDWSSLIDGRVRIVTFNYDLSLEQFLYDSILNTKFGYSTTQKNKDDVSEFIEQMGIVHVYGQLGYLNWQKDKAADNKWKFRDYGCFAKIGCEDTRMALVQNCADEIHLMRKEGVTETRNSFNSVAAHLTTANIICFLGFGYDDLNMHRLFENVVVSRKIKYFLMGHHIYDAKRGLAERWLARPADNRREVNWSSYEDDIITFMDKRFDFWY